MLVIGSERTLEPSQNIRSCWSANIATAPPMRQLRRMNDYQCWFCGKNISREANANAVMIAVESLWRCDAGSKTDDDEWQSVYAQSGCAKDRLRARP